MLKRVILFLIRKKLHVKKYEYFQFVGQKSDALYYFDDTRIVKDFNGNERDSEVSLNWLLNDNCRIVHLSKKTFIDI